MTLVSCNSTSGGGAGKGRGAAYANAQLSKRQVLQVRAKGVVMVIRGQVASKGQAQAKEGKPGLTAILSGGAGLVGADGC